MPPAVLMQNWSRRRSATPMSSRSKPLIPNRSKSISPPRKLKEKQPKIEEKPIPSKSQLQYIPHLHLKKTKHKKIHKKLKENNKEIVKSKEETNKQSSSIESLSNSFNQFMKLQKLFHTTLESDKSYIDAHRNSFTSFARSVSTIPIENENENEKNSLEDLENEVMTLHMELMKKGIVT